MVIVTLVETRRLRVTRDAGVVDQPKVTVPMSLWWMVPQYVLFDATDVFAMHGRPAGVLLRPGARSTSCGPSGSRSTSASWAFGSFISSALVSVIDMVTTARGRSWFSNNLCLHRVAAFSALELLAALSALELLAYVFIAVIYTSTRAKARLFGMWIRRRPSAAARKRTASHGRRGACHDGGAPLLRSPFYRRILPSPFPF
jgi:peptide/histidine transporter 3/4